MRCFEKLVKSRFLANAVAELTLAREAVKGSVLKDTTPMLSFRAKDRKAFYKMILDFYGLLDEMIDTPRDPNGLYYFQMDGIIFMYAQNKRYLNNAVMYNHNINGDIPVHKTKHVLPNATFHTALIDTRVQFPRRAVN